MIPYFLNPIEPIFPDPELAAETGLLAYGGNLEIQTLLLAYQKGIFPWYSPGDHYLWWSPDPRCIFEIGGVYRSKSMSKIIEKNVFQIKIDTAFREVVLNCRHIERAGQDGSWIDSELQKAYSKLHGLGYAHSVECWQDGKLVGGLFGVAMGKVFFGESMFSTVSNASKTALLALDNYLKSENYDMIDCQLYNEHLASLGAKLIPRKEFLDRLRRALPADSNLWPKGSYEFR